MENDDAYNNNCAAAASTPIGADTDHLAYIAKVEFLRPIPGKDRIELAVVKGWTCIVRKGDFRVGDLAVYLAIGSVPNFEDPNFAFLRQRGYTRIKTVKMGGVISQGLLGPLSWLSDRGGSEEEQLLKEGDDVAAALGVSKYVAPEEAAQYDAATAGAATGSRRRCFPAFVPKTHATRLQHNPEMYLAALGGSDDVIITRKEDGCSCSFVFNQGAYSVCGRNFVWNKEEDRGGTAAHYYAMQDELDMEAKLTALGRNIAIQGEICGPKINGNRMRLKVKTFSVFDVFDIDEQQYLPYDSLCTLCTALGLTTVPLLYRGSAFGLELTMEGFSALADSVDYAEGVPGEGIVVKSEAICCFDRVQFKTISNNYLLKHDL